MKKRAKLKGFTLVELLIVIVVIGVLSAMMMLSSTEAVTSAKAADIISDLRNCKTAALAWYADNLDYVEGRVNHGSTTFSSNGLFPEGVNIAKYMNGENKITYDSNTKGKYSFSGNNTDKRWVVCLEVKDGKLYEKLRLRGKSVGLKWVEWKTGNWISASADIADKAWQDSWKNGTINVGLFIR